MSKFKLLICIPSPRDIPEFADAVDLLPYDKIWIKYVHYDDVPNPYQRFVNFFLKHKEYSHLAILPDDLIVTPEGAEHLCNLAQKHKVVTGYSNMDMNNMDEYPITMNDVTPERQGRVYELLNKSNLPKKLFKARWQGTSFMILPRDIVKQLNWIGDHIDGANAGKGIQAFDVGICYQLNKMKIPIMVEPKPICNFYHMRYGGEKKVGKTQPDVWFDKLGSPRVTNKQTHLENLLDSYNRFKENQGTRMAWVDEYLNAISEYLTSTSNAEPSKEFLETLN